MVAKKKRKQQRTATASRPAPVLLPNDKGAEFNRAMNAVRSFYSNAVSWGSNLVGDARDQYSIDDVSAAQLYAISVTAWACANYRADKESSIAPLVTNANDVEVERDDNPLIWFMDNYSRLMFRASLSVLIWGKYYFRKIKNQRGLYTRLEWLNPLDVSPIIDYDRKEFAGFNVRGHSQPLRPRDIVTDMTFDPLNDFDGVSAYEVAMRQVVGDRELVRFAQKFFQDGTMLGGMLSYEGDLGDEDYKRVREEFQQFKGSQNAFRTFVAGGGMAKFDYKPMQPAPVDLAMPELKDLLRSDTCAAFNVNPILIGIGSASDPLSAQSTYEQIENKFTLNHAVKRVTWIYQSLTEQWLKVDFAAWGDLRIKPDVSDINAASKAVPERSTTALGNVGRMWTLNEGREYTGKSPLPFPAIPINPDWATTVWREGGIVLSEYRAAMGYKPLVGYRDGLIYELDPRAKLAPNIPPSANLPAPARSLPAVAPIQIAARAGVDTACYVLLSLANNPELARIQNALKAQYPDVEWTPQKDFHVTLVHTPVAADLSAVKAILPKSINPISFTTHEVDTFEGQDKQPLILRVGPEQTLVALQSGLAASFQSLGLELSPYSDPAAWQPHITLGYMQAGSELPKWDRDVTLTSATLICSIESGDSFQSIAVTRAQDGIMEAEILPASPMRTDPLLTKARLYELDNWQKKTKHKGAGASFEHKELSPDVAQWVRSELDGHWNPQAVFGEARSAVRAGRAPRPLGATKEDAQAYWSDFDGLQHDISQAWLLYMNRVSSGLFDAVVDQRGADLENVFAREHGPLLQEWVGTVQQPGDLARVMLAGMSAGQRSLEKEIAANPNKPRDLAFDITWNLASGQALEFIQSYALNLITDIDGTTRDSIRSAVDKYVAEGQDRDTLREAIAKTLVPPGGTITDAIRARATLIGNTESMNAFRSGARNRWQTAGVQESQWETVRDSKVCSVCRSLYHVRAPLGSGFRSPVTGQTYYGLAHPLDRCFERPVL